MGILLQLYIRVREGNGLPESLGAMEVPDPVDDARLLLLSLLSLLLLSRRPPLP